ncbi:MAG TPA: HAD family hydrolase [Vicinamibacterales bacterium]|nr:HAD family hydrolase [Vicinamibacterales bacterium]
MTRVVFFDVDFTLIEPGPAFQADGYGAFCAHYGIAVEPARFDAAVAAAATVLEDRDEYAYDPDVFVRYTRRIIEGMGGAGAQLDACAREIFDEWTSFHHFSLYPDVAPTLRRLVADGIRIGLISNGQRSLEAFERHFALEGLIDAAIASPDHGFMKPHPSIFEAALRLVEVPARDALMVGDSLRHDIEGARGAGLRAVLVRRHGGTPPADQDEVLRRLGVPVLESLEGLPALL